MSFRARVISLVLAALLVCVALYWFSPVDIAISHLFYNGYTFSWRSASLARFKHNLVQPMAWTLAILFLTMTIYHFRQRSGWRRWLFLLLSLIIGPGLITNTILKDNWGRARPHQIAEFGGQAQFTPAFVMADQCVRNCSFTSGDSSFGFWFHTLAYVAQRRRRQIFYTGLALGAGFGLLRVGMGAHFFSDVLIGGFFMLASSAALFALMFGRQALGISWHEWLGGARSAAAKLPTATSQVAG